MAKQQNKMNLNFLSDKIPWFGKYSGYECLNQYIPKDVYQKTFLTSKESFKLKLIGKFYQYKTSTKNVKSSRLAVGMEFLSAAKYDTINHILYCEANLHLLKSIRKVDLNNIAATIHLPFSQWSDEKLSKLKVLRNALILYDSEVNKFKEYLPNGNLQVIRHGVDNSIFKPGLNPRDSTKILCVGHYLRNFKMLERVIGKLLQQHKHVSFHIVLPSLFRNQDSIKNIARSKQVFFYEGLSDESLLNLYQTCGSLLIPLIDSGANTAIVQGLACGIPIITTNVGGISSYGGNDIYPIIENDDDDSMVNLTTRYIDDLDYSLVCSSRIRQFSLDKLDWNISALHHLKYYYSILKNDVN